LYSRGGHAYVYLIYGIHYCFNIVSSIEDDPQGVLIRAVEPLKNQNCSLPFLCNKSKKFYHYTNGPGKLCRVLNINMNFNNIDLTVSNLIYLEDQPEIEKDKIVITKRVNVNYAKEDKERL
jgi:DNA-3-methyladenine glycosylase